VSRSVSLEPHEPLALPRAALAALKPASWPKLGVPMALGQVIGALDAGRLSPGALLVGLLFTLFDIVFVVLVNDWADRDVDTLKRTLFPHSGSPKTIPDGLLAAAPVLAFGVVAGVAAVATAVVGGRWLDLPWLAVGGVAGVGFFVAYSLPPLALNYRGGGEVLEAVGVGLLLPWIGAYAQSRHVLPSGLLWLAGFMALSFASAVASGLADEVSDRRGGKVTVTTRFGNAAARRIIESSVLVGVVLWALVPALLRSPHAALAAAFAIGVALFHARRMRRESGAAVTSAFGPQRVYKVHLHRAIWEGALALGAALATLSAGA
jgi:1,4-dihydroxy-2-naphthoate octaprenyltransferase/chlorophyll synthase